MKKRIIAVAILLAVVFAGTGKLYSQAIPDKKITKEERVKWFFDARFGMMITWGAYAQAGGYWKGVYEGGYSEWLKFRQIPNVEYDSLIREFNPVEFNAANWVAIAKGAGMKYMVMMAKHHDGFALYDSKVSTYDIVDMTRFKRDPVAELAAECQKQGLKFGVYYSVDRDWHHPDAACDGRYNQCNFWDYPQNKAPDAMERWHNSYFPNYAYKQVEELVTRYPIDIVWFDGIGLKTRKEIAKLDSLIHTLRPNCLINSRISNFVGSTDGDYGSKGDNETPGGYQAGGWENPGTLGFSYGYSVHDSLMSPKRAVHNLIDIVSKGGNYLLNVGPDGKGKIIPEATNILYKMGDWLRIYGASIYGADGMPYSPPENIRITGKQHQLFIHLFDPTNKTVVLNGIMKEAGKFLTGVKKAYMLADPRKQPLKFQLNEDGLSVDLSANPIPADKLNPLAEVIVVNDVDENIAAAKPYPDWKYSGSMFIITTGEGVGAYLPVSSKVNDFPLLIRLDKSSFDFTHALANGEDIRFATAGGQRLAYQIENWNAANGAANIWVRIPEIRGNERQEIKMFWGKNDAPNESDGSAVFNESNGYLTVVHMDSKLKDEAGSVKPVNVGATETDGMVGRAMRFEETHGISCGEKIMNFPSGSAPSSTEVWVRSDQPNGLILGWGNEEKTGKVTMNFASPPQIKMDCYWSGANVNSGWCPVKEWFHVVHTYQQGDSRIYINGRLYGASASVKNPLAIKSPVGFWIGGWKNDYWFTGEIDEVRISKVTRSPEWINLEYENQKPEQTLVGALVKPGNSFSVSSQKITIEEGKSVTITAQADGAIKTSWGNDIYTLSTDRLSYTFNAGRVTGDVYTSLTFTAVYPDEVKTIEIPIKITEQIPEPVFTLKAPEFWNGRDPIEIIPEITNLKEMIAKGAGQLNYTWKVYGGAVIKKESEKLVLLRSQCSGIITVVLILNNGGPEVQSWVKLTVKEPENDPWIIKSAGAIEKPVDNQFVARNDKNEGILHYNGKLTSTADSVFVRVYADGKQISQQAHKVLADKAYAFELKLKPGLVKYKIELGSKVGSKEKVLESVGNIVCGDAYIIDGQSNAEANDYGKAVNPYTSDFLRSFGCADTDPAKSRLNLWGNAVSYDNQGAKLQIGYWGIELGKMLIENNKIPVCIINGSVGGSRIDVHQRNEANPTDSTTIYGRLLWRIQKAGLTDGIRGAFWHQGENDQGAAGPSGRFGWEDYQQYFIDMSAAWKQDYPNIQHYYLFQIWPRSCAMTENGSDNTLREKQRTLPSLFSHMSVMSTLGIKPPGGCHYPPEGYAQIARLICPLVEHDNYGRFFDHTITAPDLISARYTSTKSDEISIEFNQPVVWKDTLASQFYLNGNSGMVGSGSVTGNILKIKLKEPLKASRISYLDSKLWSQDNLLWGENGIAALTFWDVPLMRFIPVSDSSIQSGLSAYNWVKEKAGISSSVCGASISVQFNFTNSVAVEISTSHMAFESPDRFPILAWTVNGGPVQTHQIKAGEKSIQLAYGPKNPVIELYIKGMSPMEDRYNGDLPPNSVKITGFIVEAYGKAYPTNSTGKHWLTIGDSILSGDGAALTADQGRPADDLWAASDNARASYGYLLARHYGYLESRLAFGGYDWGGGMAANPSLHVLIDNMTSTKSRLVDGKLYPVPEVCMINLGENGAPAAKDVIEALKKLRTRVNPSTKIIVMIPVSGRAVKEVTLSFNQYKTNTGDRYVYLVDLGKIAFSTGDGQHPTAGGHESIYKAALTAFDSIFDVISLWNGKAPDGQGKFTAENPVITVHHPEKPNGAMVVICPGGGYGGLVKGPEGHGIAEWLNENGITGLVLEYRLPKGRQEVPLLDAQRAIRLARSKAANWGCDPKRIGIIGFSAGGHLASTAATHFDEGDKKAADPIARLSSRPDFAILIYPVITMGPKTHEGSKRNLLGPDPKEESVNRFSNEKQVTSLTPPVFLAHALDDDMVPPDNSEMFYNAMIAHNSKTYYLRLPSGGHGLNGYSGPMWEEWKTTSLQWLKDIKIIPKTGKK